MDFGDVIQYLSNKIILITGATGFLAKILVEKILRVQPDVANLYLLIRAKDIKSAQQRLYDEVLSKELFKNLMEIKGDKFDSFISEKVTIIVGDTSQPDLGMNDSIIKEDTFKKIDAIIHVAATTKFNERYDLALSINSLGAIHIINFANQCPKLQILVHVSTAYVWRQKTGPISEKPLKMGEKLNGVPELSIDAEKSLIDDALSDLATKGASQKDIRNTMKSLGQKRASLYGWPNTYVFTKAMGEMLVEQHRGNLPVIVVRPTMICSTYKEPFPGWIEGFGSLGFWTLAYTKGFIKFVHVNKDCVLDLIPADMVVNVMITAMVAHANKPSLTVYHVGSSLRNPVKPSKVRDIHFQYFNKKPCNFDDHGILVKVPPSKTRLVQSKAVFIVILLILLLPKLLALKIANIASCNYFKADDYDKLKMQLMANVKVVEIFKHYLLFTGIFDDQNTEKL